MNELRKESSIVKQDDLFLTVIKTDVNLSRLPLFAVSRKNLKTELVKEWIFAETRENKHAELTWRIIATPQYGYPSPFAKKVHRAIEYMLTQNGFPIPEYLEFSLYEIANILDLKRTGDVYSGKVYADIKDALFSITSTSIESKGVFCYLDNGKKRYVHDMFHLYERVVFAGEILPDETIAEKNRVYFGEWYLKALNSLYIKPLDFPYWKSLRSDIACRLYEYLSIRVAPKMM